MVDNSVYSVYVHVYRLYSQCCKQPELCVCCLYVLYCAYMELFLIYTPLVTLLSNCTIYAIPTHCTCHILNTILYIIHHYTIYTQHYTILNTILYTPLYSGEPLVDVVDPKALITGPKPVLAIDISTCTREVGGWVVRIMTMTAYIYIIIYTSMHTCTLFL